MNRKLAVLVISCDNYQDAWGPFFGLFAKFWPDCPYRRYLGTNQKDFNHPNVTVIRSGSDISWADNVRSYLEQIDEHYVISILEDFFISRPVQTDVVEKAFDLVLRDGIDWFGLILPKKGNRYRGEQDVYYVDSHDDYCVSTSIAIWKKDAFISLLEPGTSAWDFEVRNSKKVNESGVFPGLFVTAGQDHFLCLNGIWRGKWVRSSVEFCRQLGIAVDTSRRPFMSIRDVIWEFAKINGRKFLPSVLLRLTKRTMIKIGFSKRFVSLD